MVFMGDGCVRFSVEELNGIEFKLKNSVKRTYKFKKYHSLLMKHQEVDFGRNRALAIAMFLYIKKDKRCSLDNTRAFQLIKSEECYRMTRVCSPDISDNMTTLPIDLSSMHMLNELSEDKDFVNEQPEVSIVPSNELSTSGTFITALVIIIFSIVLVMCGIEVGESIYQERVEYKPTNKAYKKCEVLKQNKDYISTRCYYKNNIIGGQYE